MGGTISWDSWGSLQQDGETARLRRSGGPGTYLRYLLLYAWREGVSGHSSFADWPSWDSPLEPLAPGSQSVIALHAVALFFIANAAAEVFFQREQQIERDVRWLEALRLRACVM